MVNIDFIARCVALEFETINYGRSLKQLSRTFYDLAELDSECEFKSFYSEVQKHYRIKRKEHHLWKH